MHNFKKVQDSHGQGEMGLPIDHTGRVILGSQKEFILAAQNEPKYGASPMIYLHAGLKIGSAIPYAILWESDKDSLVLGP